MDKSKRKDGEKEKLVWENEETFLQGSTQVEITSASKKHGGKLYSIVFGRVFSERTSKFFRPHDLQDIAELSERARLWIQADKGENSDNQSNRRY